MTLFIIGNAFLFYLLYDVAKNDSYNNFNLSVAFGVDIFTKIYKIVLIILIIIFNLFFLEYNEWIDII